MCATGAMYAAGAKDCRVQEQGRADVYAATRGAGHTLIDAIGGDKDPYLHSMGQADYPLG